MNDDFNDFNDVLASLGPEVVEKIISGSLPYGSENSDANLRRSDWKWFDELSLEDKTTWLVKNLVPESSLGLLYGAPGSGKSFLAVDLAMSVALGVEWSGIKVSPGAVLYVALEGGLGLKARFLAHAIKFSGVAMDQIPLAVWSTALNLCTSIDDTELLIKEVPKGIRG